MVDRGMAAQFPKTEAGVDTGDSAVGSTTRGFNIVLLTHFGPGPDFSSG